MTMTIAPSRPTRPTRAAAATPGARSVPAAAPDPRSLSRWASRIAADGIEAHEDLAGNVVDAASRRGLCPVLVDVLADTTEPAVARERAFGRLALALTLAREATSRV